MYVYIVQNIIIIIHNNQLKTCIGNLEPNYVNLGKAKRKREFLSIRKGVVAYLDSNAAVTIDEQAYAVTVCCAECHMLISEGVCCSPCLSF